MLNGKLSIHMGAVFPKKTELLCAFCFPAHSAQGSASTSSIQLECFSGCFRAFNRKSKYKYVPIARISTHRATAVWAQSRLLYGGFTLAAPPLRPAICRSGFPVDFFLPRCGQLALKRPKCKGLRGFSKPGIAERAQSGACFSCGAVYHTIIPFRSAAQFHGACRGRRNATPDRTSPAAANGLRLPRQHRGAAANPPSP